MADMPPIGVFQSLRLDIQKSPFKDAKSLSSLLDSLTATAKECFLESGEHETTAFFVTNEDVHIFCGALPDGDGKDAVACLYQNLAKQHKAKGFGFIAEAWASNDDSGVLPSQAPDRKEILMITAEWIGEGGSVRSLEIVRKGENASLAEYVESMEPAEGRFCHILPPKPEMN